MRFVYVCLCVSMCRLCEREEIAKELGDEGV